MQYKGGFDFDFLIHENFSELNFSDCLIYVYIEWIEFLLQS